MLYGDGTTVTTKCVAVRRTKLFAKEYVDKWQCGTQEQKQRVRLSVMGRFLHSLSLKEFATNDRKNKQASSNYSKLYKLFSL